MTLLQISVKDSNHCIVHKFNSRYKFINEVQCQFLMNCLNWENARTVWPFQCFLTFLCLEGHDDPLGLNFEGQSMFKGVNRSLIWLIYYFILIKYFVLLISHLYAQCRNIKRSRKLCLMILSIRWNSLWKDHGTIKNTERMTKA